MAKKPKAGHVFGTDGLRTCEKEINKGKIDNREGAQV